MKLPRKTAGKIRAPVVMWNSWNQRDLNSPAIISRDYFFTLHIVSLLDLTLSNICMLPLKLIFFGGGDLRCCSKNIICKLI